MLCSSAGPAADCWFPRMYIVACARETCTPELTRQVVYGTLVLHRILMCLGYSVCAQLRGHPGLGAQRRPAFAAAGCLRKAPALQARLHTSTFGFLTLLWVYPALCGSTADARARGTLLRVGNRLYGIPYNIVARCPSADPRAELELGMGLSSSKSASKFGCGQIPRKSSHLL